MDALVEVREGVAVMGMVARSRFDEAAGERNELHIHTAYEHWAMYIGLTGWQESHPIRTNLAPEGVKLNSLGLPHCSKGHEILGICIVWSGIG